MAGKHSAAAGGDNKKPEKNISIWETGKQSRGNGYIHRESMGNYMAKLYLSVPGDFNHP